MSSRLLFPEAASAADALTFAGRAARLGEDAVRLQAADGTLAMTAPVLTPQGLGDATPTVLGMRTLAVDPELICDVVVVASQLRADAADPQAVVLPDAGLAAAWAGIAPPRAGWEPQAGIAAAVLAEKAHGGMARVARTVPTDAGEDAVRTVRAAIWGMPEPALGDLPLGVAFAAATLGFVNGAETARVLTAGRWTRVSLHRGHILVRGPVASGLTAVRTTGTRP